jgi:SAM-dependent methyltransferase
VDHNDHVGLIRAGVEGAGRRWLELGAGEGAFTLALADVLGTGGEIVAVDRDAGALRRLGAEIGRRFPGTTLTTVVGDFRDALPDGPFDGVLAANSLHFVADPLAVVLRARATLRPGGRLIVVEYDADRGNPWVPHPFSFRTWQSMSAQAGLAETRLIGRVPSRFLGSIYAAVSEIPSAPGRDDVPPDAKVGRRPSGDAPHGSVRGQAGSPLPRQLTFGFQSLNSPLGFGRHSQR